MCLRPIYFTHVRHPDRTPLPHHRDALRGRGRITEENIGEALREVRVALLEADVALPVVKSFIDAVKVEGARRRGGPEPHPGPGLHRHPAPRAGRAHGRGAGGLQAARPAADRGAARGPAGRGQDHHRCEARALADRASSASACSWSAPTCAALLRCCSSSGWRARWAPQYFAADAQSAPGRYRARRPGAGQARRVRRADRRHRRAACTWMRR